MGKTADETILEREVLKIRELEEHIKANLSAFSDDSAGEPRQEDIEHLGNLATETLRMMDRLDQQLTDSEKELNKIKAKKMRESALNGLRIKRKHFEKLKSSYEKGFKQGYDEGLNKKAKFEIPLTVNIVCPYCNSETKFKTKVTEGECNCSNCDKPILFIVGEVVGVRGLGGYTVKPVVVRISKLEGGERTVSWMGSNAGYDLRGGDRIALVYKKKLFGGYGTKPCFVCNHSLQEFVKL